MRKLSFQKGTSALIIMAIMVTLLCGTTTSFALSNGYLYATDVGLSATRTTEAITYATQEVWYKFTVPTGGAAYSFALKDMPSGNPYGYDVRYEVTPSARPQVYRNTSTLSATNSRNMVGVFDNAGTYYIRIVSLTGAYSSTPFKFTVSVGYGGYSAWLTGVTSSNNSLDWAACAEMMGKYKYYRKISSTYPSRTFSNAARFIQSGGTSDTGTPTNTKGTLAQTVTAADYIYTGDYAITPSFAVETAAVYDPHDFLKVIWANDATMTLKLDNILYPYPPLQHFITLESVYIDDWYMDFKDPWTTSSTSVDYDDFITNGYAPDGYETEYNGDNIVYAQ